METGGKPGKPGRPRLARKSARKVAANTRAMHAATRKGRALAWATRARRKVAATLDTPPPRGVIIVAAVLVAAGALFGWMLYRSADNSESQLEATAGSVIEECSKSDAFAREARARGLCVVAEQAAETPSATETGRTDAEVTILINRVLDERGTPGGGVTVEQVREIVRQVLPGLTSQQVESAAAAYLAANLERLRGEKGDPGTPGDPGEPGRGIFAGPRYERDSDGTCMSVVTYSDGTVYRAPTGDAMCPGGGTPSTTVTTTPEPTGEPTAGPEPTTDPTPPTQPTTPAPTTPPAPTEDDGGLLGGLLGD